MKPDPMRPLFDRGPRFVSARASILRAVLRFEVRGTLAAFFGQRPFIVDERPVGNAVRIALTFYAIDRDSMAPPPVKPTRVPGAPFVFDRPIQQPTRPFVLDKFPEFDWLESATDAQLDSYLRGMCLEALTHELDECIHINGARVFDPH